MDKPSYVTTLEKIYGAPSQNGFGSAVFFEKSKPAGNLEKMALEKYEYFVGKLWEQYGKDAWMGPWKQVYTRAAGVKPAIVAELRSIKGSDAQMQVGMILDVPNEPTVAEKALSAAYDAADVVDLRVYLIGDGGAMSGLLLAGQRKNGDTTFLVFLLD